MIESPHAQLADFCDFAALDQNPARLEAQAARELARAKAAGRPTADLEVALAMTVMYQRRLPEAVGLIRSVLERHPDHALARWCDVVLALYMREAWPVVLAKFHARWAVGVNGDCPVPAEVTWDGSPLNGRTLLFAGEGGRGDQIQFLRFVPWLKAAGAGRIVVSVRPDIMPIAQTVAGVDAVVPTAPDSNQPVDPGQYDTGLPMMGAPGMLKLSYETVPADVPYTHVPDSDLHAARLRFASPGKSVLNVGLCRIAAKDFRTLALELFHPLAAIPGIRLFSLAEESALEAASAGFPIEPLGSSDIVADAAAICALDLIISVDTMIAHLAGSLGKPVWLLLSSFPDCRWGLDEDRTPWYPSMRIFRRPSQDWKPVIHNVVTELIRLAQARGAFQVLHPRHHAGAAEAM